jgi:hypothetical protein
MKTYRIVLPLVLFLVLVGGMVLPTSAAELVTVNVGTVLKTGVAGGARLGINVDYWWDDNGNRVAGATPLRNAIMNMGPKVWRYPGGEKSDGYLWSIPPFTAPNPQLARVSTQDWPANDPLYLNPPSIPGSPWAHPIYDFDEFMADCQAAGCTPIIVVAYDGIYKAAYSGGTSLTRQQALDTSAAWVHYANTVKNYNIKYWEIGNETYNPGYMGGDPGRTVQAQDFIEFCNNMKVQDPTIWCGINTEKQSDFTTLLSVAHASIDFLDVHSYEAWDYRGYSSYSGGSLNPNVKVDYAWIPLQNYPADKDRIKIFVNETGGITFGIRGSWTQADLGHALMNFEDMALLMKDSRVEYTAYWTTHWIEQEAAGNVWPTYTESEYDALKPDNSLSPQGWALKLLSNYLLADMVSATGTAKVGVYASHDPATGALNLWLINRSTTASPTTVTLQNYTAPATGNLSTFTGTDSTDMFPTFASAGTVAVSANQINLTLAPVSINVIQFGSGGGGPTATPTRTNTPVPPTNTPTAGPSPTPTRTSTPQPPTATPTQTNTPLPTATPGGAPVMHVFDMYTTDINGNPKSSFVSGETVYWKVKIVDQSGNPVSGALVDTYIKRPTGANYISTQKATTDATGWTPLFNKTISVGSTPGTWTINLNGVTKTGATYDPAANVISVAYFTDV